MGIRKKVWLWQAVWSAILLAGVPQAEAAGCSAEQASQVRIGQQAWRVQTAWRDVERERGLSGRASLAAGTGMWFVLPEDTLAGFWMQGMAFPIDLIWITPDLRVAGSLRLQPCGRGPCPVHRPGTPVRYVLEVNAGEFAGHRGDAVSWSCAP